MYTRLSVMQAMADPAVCAENLDWCQQMFDYLQKFTVSTPLMSAVTVTCHNIQSKFVSAGYSELDNKFINRLASEVCI